MANTEHEKILKEGIDAWNGWRRANPTIQPDLSGINLWEHNLTGSIEESAEGFLSESFNVNGKRRFFYEISERSWWDLSGVKLCNATLCFAHLANLNLNEADLSYANFYGSSLTDVLLECADLRGALFRETVLATSYLRGSKNLETCVHLGPSSIDIQTLLNSGPLPVLFLRGLGLPEDYIDVLPRILDHSDRFFSCFISHSSKDRDFVETLYKDLQNKGVRCYYFPETAKSGESIWGDIGRALKGHDKLVLVCSQSSLQSAAVLREIERALQREDQDNKNIVFPIRIDDYIFEAWEHERKADIVGKVVADFREWKKPEKYQQLFARLLQDLRP